MTSNTSPHITLPIVTIDPTFATVIQDVSKGAVPSEKFWISCYKSDHPSVHAKISAALDEKDRELVILNVMEGNVKFVREDRNYTVTCSSLDISPTRVLAPVQEYLDVERSNAHRPQRITAFDIAPDGSKFATGFLDGSVFIYPTTPVPTGVPDFPIANNITLEETRTIARPHVSTVTRLQFFPSSRVLLSAGADFSLSILPAELPTGPMRVTPARTLRGHSRTVTSVAIVGVGRNVLSASLDANMKLWDVSTGAVISSLLAVSPILSLSLGERTPIADEDEPEPPAASDPREVRDVQTKTAFCGLQDGTVELFDLRTKAAVYRSSRESAYGALSAICYAPGRQLLVTGSAKGLVAAYDTRTLNTPLTTFRRNESGIEDLQFVLGENEGEVGLAIATADGLPYVAGLVPDGPEVDTELVGADCDSVTSVRVRTGEQGRREVWTASHDAIVRRYLI